MDNKYASIPLELGQDEIYRLMLIAHERDITLNALVTQILTDALAREGLPVTESTLNLTLDI